MHNMPILDYVTRAEQESEATVDRVTKSGVHNKVDSK